MKSVNEKEFLVLIETYKSINLQRLQEKYDENHCVYKTLNKITGFGNTSKCTLCLGTRKSNRGDYRNCRLCVYGITSDLLHPCTEDDNERTFDAIVDADSPESLLVAIKNRAKHMKKVWKQYQKQI